MNEKRAESSGFNGFYDSTELDVPDICKSHEPADVAIADLHSRVRDMLSNGVSTVRIFREIKDDKYCTAIQKRRILEELHMK